MSEGETVMTNIMVLGLLLRMGAMSGYEIQQKMQSAQTDQWAFVQPASIYHALRKLEKDGLVELKTLEQTGNRTKAIYSATDRGRDAFPSMLVQAFEKSPVVFPAPLYTLLTFVEDVPQEALLHAITVQQRDIQAIYESMEAGHKAKAEVMQEVPRNVELIFRNIYDQCRLQLRFLEELKRELLERPASTQQKHGQ